LSQEESIQRFGDYHLVERIAVGGMAEVWRARAYGLAGFEKTLVIKRILDKLARDEEFVRLFIDEARIAVLLQHANIVQVFDLGQAEGTLYMAMEYVHGLDLARLIAKVREQGPFPIPLALFLVGEVLKALRFAHERTSDEGAALNLVHCDISPHNVLISHAGEVKITDFGISRAAFQAQSLHESVRGKHAYMSPEQIENQQLDGRSDLFSLGILMWELLTGRRLFKARTKDETLQRVKRAEVPSPRLYRPQVSEELEAIVLKALSRLPEHRYQSAAEMLESIANLMVREGQRTTNHDLSQYLLQVGVGTTAARVSEMSAATVTLVVLAAEAVPFGHSPPTELTIDDVAEEWTDVLVRSGAQIWERDRRSLLAVWVVDEELDTTMPMAVEAVQQVRTLAREQGFVLAVGMVPGRSRIFNDTRRPARGWELAGPFYLARWMMNLSAHRGRIMLTHAGVKHIPLKPAEKLGRVAIEDDKSIQLYEL
jgi:hypothetical protein